MRLNDVVRLTASALTAHLVRSGLMLFAMSIGVASVIVLTGLGEGARRYVVGEFESLGTNLVIVLPGRSETAGGPGGLLGETTRDLTIEDALALRRHPAVTRVAPLVVGSAAISFGARQRDVPLLGGTAELLEIRRWKMAQGQFLPAADWSEGGSAVVVGAKVARELFGNTRALGQWVRIGDRRFRVIGVMATEGRSIGMDVEELVLVPVVSGQALLNTNSLFRVLIETRSDEELANVTEFVANTIKARHQGEQDVTVITQDAVLSTFNKILRALTLTVGGIAAISLVVAGILIMNVMLVAVTQRTSEIGLLKALGASAGQIQRLFLTEAAMLSSAGAVAGLTIGLLGCTALAHAYPVLPVRPPWWSVMAAVSVALLTGLLFGALPARRASRMDPVRALGKR